MAWPMLRNGVLKMAPGFLSGSCSFLINLYVWNVGWGEGSGHPPITASGGLVLESTIPHGAWTFLGKVSLTLSWHSVFTANDRVENSH